MFYQNQDAGLPAEHNVHSKVWRRMSSAIIFLVVVALVAILYLAKAVLLPIAIASFIALFASPLLRVLSVIYLPKTVASFLIVSALCVVVFYLFSLLSEPAMHWLSILPQLGERITFELKHTELPLDALELNSASGAAEGVFAPLTAVIAQMSIQLLIQIAAVIMLTYFFLSYGEKFMYSVVSACPSFSLKKKMVLIFRAIRNDVSTYVLSISLINVALGIATASVLTYIGFEDALFWGALATFLNFAPYVGPLFLAFLLALAAFAAAYPLDKVLLAPSVFLVVNAIESQLVTPTVLGRRFNINPLLVVVWMLICGWVWGAAGMLLAIPFLMSLRLACSHFNFLGSWGRILETPKSARTRPTAFSTKPLKILHWKRPLR